MLIDDVMTTGATANEIAKILRRAGAACVEVAVVVAVVVVTVAVGVPVTAPFTRSSFAISTPEVASMNRTDIFPAGRETKDAPESVFVRINPEPV